MKQTKKGNHRKLCKRVSHIEIIKALGSTISHHWNFLSFTLSGAGNISFTEKVELGCESFPKTQNGC